MNVSVLVVRELRSRGVSIVRVTEVLDARSTDVDIVALAASSQWVLLTHDQDLTMNLGGDSRDVFPFVTNGGIPCPLPTTPSQPIPIPPDAVYNYSVARMRQWNLVFEYAMQKGIMLNMVLAEQEHGNINFLGGCAATGGAAHTTARWLFLKQMIAMFGHNLAIKWNLCEENNIDPNLAPLPNPYAYPIQFSVAELAETAAWIEQWDVYNHPVSVHTTANSLDLYSAMVAAASADWLDATSLQVHGEKNPNGAPCLGGCPESTNYTSIPAQARDLFWSNGAGRKIVVDVDETGAGWRGSGPDNGAGPQFEWTGPDDRRRRILYDILFAGANLEWYFGYWDTSSNIGGDLNLENFMTRDMLFRYTKRARELVESYDFVNMRPWDALLSMNCTGSPADLILSGPYNDGDACDQEFGRPRVFAKPDGAILIHYPSFNSLLSPETGQVDLPAASTTVHRYTGAWFDPRAIGAGVQLPLISNINGSTFHAPPPPIGFGLLEDWVYILLPS